MRKRMKAGDKDRPAIRAIKKKLCDQLTTRFGLDAPDPSSVPVIAAALDPLYKALKFLTDEQKKEVKAELHERCTARQSSASSEAASPDVKPKSKRALLQSLHDDSSDEEEEIDTPTEKISAFFAQKLRIDKSKIDPLQWWKENEKRYPALAQEARRVLSMPSTSASSERVFSTVGRVVTFLRASLSPENVDALVFLHRNTSYQWQSVASPDVVVKPEEQYKEAPALPVL